MSYKNVRIRTKLLFSYLIVILVTVSMIGYLSYRISTKEAVSNTEAFSQVLLDQLAVNVPNRAKYFEQSTYAIQNNKDFYSMLSQDLTNTTEQQLYLNQRFMQSYLSLFFGLNMNVRAVIVKTNSGQLYWSEEKAFYGFKSGMNDQMAREKFEWTLNQQRAYAGFQSLWLPSQEPGEVTFTRALINSNTLETVGQIIFYLDSGFLEAVNEMKRRINGGSVVILNRHSEVLYAEAETRPTINQWLITADRSTQSQITLEQDGKKYFISNQYSENKLWDLILIVPLSEMTRSSNQLRLYILLTSLVSLLVTVMIAFGISGHVTGNIRKLERTMRKVEFGDFTVQVSPTSRDEIGLLGLRFNDMITRINELIHGLYIERMAKQQAEFQVLKAQIQPHFLYNTLGSILWLARMNRQTTISQMVHNLIELLKVSVKKTSEYVNVQEEFGYIDNYLSIQKFRFENRFEIVYELDESVKQNKMLNFILQPLVENSLLHGIEMSKGCGLITIRAYPFDQQLRLEVEDNGVGMSEELLHKIMSADPDREHFPGLHSIGVHNVNERIKLYYGNEYGLHYRSELGNGTVATVVLPLQHHEGGKSNAKRDDRGR